MKAKLSLTCGVGRRIIKTVRGTKGPTQKRRKAERRLSWLRRLPASRLSSSLSPTLTTLRSMRCWARCSNPSLSPARLWLLRLALPTRTLLVRLLRTPLLRSLLRTWWIWAFLRLPLLRRLLRCCAWPVSWGFLRRPLRERRSPTRRWLRVSPKTWASR